MTDRIRIGADIGGTFTDIVLEGGGQFETTKVLTSYDAPERAILEGVGRVCALAGIEPGAIEQIIHGTTLATNALIERKGARTALITTDGFRDVIEMRTESRFEQYDLNLKLPEPLLPRQRRYTVKERVAADGTVLVPLDDDGLEDLVEALERGNYESVAVGFLHSYANPSHELAVRDILRERLPETLISLSSEVSPQMREYERFNTTVANAYIQPLMKSYLDRLAGALEDMGISCPVYLMHSGGGVMSLESAAAFPVRLVESGPAGGAIFAADLAQRHRLNRVLSFDMGGTTAKICLLREAAPKTARVFEVARSYRFKKGSGMPISIPVIDMVEIGAGGGSLASVDMLGRLQVGPESAGSEPGPAAYGRGGTQPAVTDADVILGRIDPASFAGGRIEIQNDTARTALDSAIGNKLNLDTLGAAAGVAEVVDEAMANAARMHAVENGEDLSDYTMIAFGGAAPLHAARLASKLGIRSCLVPPGAGVGSAIGFLRAPFSFEATRSVFMNLGEFDAETATSIVAEISEDATTFVRACDPDSTIDTHCRAYMRYRGQGWEIPVVLDPNDLSPGRLTSDFETEYTRLFGRIVEGLEIEITVWAADARTRVQPKTPLVAVNESRCIDEWPTRDIFDAGKGRLIETSVIPRAGMTPGTNVAGAAIVTEAETCTVVPSDATVSVAADGTLCLRIGAGSKGDQADA